MARRRRWLIQRHGEEFDVLRNGRRLCSRVPEDVARRYVREHRGPGDAAEIEEHDGYRVPVR